MIPCISFLDSTFQSSLVPFQCVTVFNSVTFSARYVFYDIAASASWVALLGTLQQLPSHAPSYRLRDHDFNAVATNLVLCLLREHVWDGNYLCANFDNRRKIYRIKLLLHQLVLYLYKGTISQGFINLSLYAILARGKVHVKRKREIKLYLFACESFKCSILNFSLFLSSFF